MHSIWKKVIMEIFSAGSEVNFQMLFENCFDLFPAFSCFMFAYFSGLKGTQRVEKSSRASKHLAFM